MSAPSGPVLAVNARDPEEVRVALAEDGALLDVRSSRRDRASAVGDLYLGRVKQVEDGLDAAFVDLGGRRPGFLHVGNVHPAYADPNADPAAVAATPAPGAAVQVGDDDAPPAEEEAPPRISTLLRPGQRVLVQVLRDPVRGKGATLTTFVSLAGHALVWMPSLGRVGVSRRIGDEEERARLREVLEGLAEEGEPPPLIARTAAQGMTRRALRHEHARLHAIWERVADACRHEPAPALVHREDTPAVRAVRELFHPGVARLVTDDEDAAVQLERFLGERAPGAPLEVERWTGRRPLFEQLALEADWQALFRMRVPVGGGASIVIHETEALTAVDVNSGRVEGTSLEETALETNLRAAGEIARQARLRDLGGIVVVDFIDMRAADHRRRVESALRDGLRRDRARMKVGRLGSFGLQAFTRRRLGTGLPRGAEALCRACGGSGSTLHHAAGALRTLRRLRAHESGAGLRVRAQPGVIAELRGALRGAVEELGLAVEWVGDPQVPAGEPVIESRDLLAGGSGGG